MAWIKVRQAVALFLLVSFLGSCVTNSPYSNIPDNQLTAQQRELKRRSSAFNKTIWEGVGAGALGGALIGGLIDRDWKGAAIGAGVGAVAGGIAGNYIAKRQKEYANQEDLLNAMITDVRSKNDEAESLVVAMEQVNEENKKKLASLNEKYSKGLITEADLLKEKQSIEQDNKLIKDSIASANGQLKTFREAREIYVKSNATTNTSDLDSQITALEGKINSMNTIAQNLGQA